VDDFLQFWLSTLTIRQCCDIVGWATIWQPPISKRSSFGSVQCVCINIWCLIVAGRTRVLGFCLVELVNWIRTEDQTSSLSKRVCTLSATDCNLHKHCWCITAGLFSLMVSTDVTSMKFLYVEPCLYRDRWLCQGSSISLYNQPLLVSSLCSL